MPYSEAEQNVAIKLSTHAGQEFDIVVKGSMKMQVGSHVELLHEGDSIYYNSAAPHGMIATGGADCQIYAIVLKGAEEFVPEQDRFQKLIDAKIARQDRETVSTPFVETTLDENGILNGITFKNEEKFNFAFDIVDKLAEKCPEKLAMLHVSRDKTERRFTFDDISRWSSKTANYLESLGIRRGDRVLVVLKRHYQFWFVITALHKMGAVIIPATNLLMEHDFDYRYKAAGVKAVICTSDGQVADEADRAAQNSDTVDVKIMVGENRLGWHDFDKEVESFPDTYGRKPDAPCGSDPMLMFFTSGTTGYPKIAEHNYKYALGHYITAKYWHNVNPDGLHFTISDTGWGTTAGEALNPEVYEQWKRATGLSLMEGFGQTETTLTVYNPVGSVPKTGSMGVPSPLYDVDIILPDGSSAPVGETGEIVVRTDRKTPCGLFMGYYRDEDRTKEAWCDNVYHTGDTAWRDEDGYFWYVGRTDDVIKSSGYRIGPFEIESVIMELPYVLECAVTSAPDPVRGQVVKAFIVLTKGTEGTDALKKEIQTYVKKHTAPYKYPRLVEFRDDLPKTISGKIRRVELKG